MWHNYWLLLGLNYYWWFTGKRFFKLPDEQTIKAAKTAAQDSANEFFNRFAHQYPQDITDIIIEAYKKEDLDTVIKLCSTIKLLELAKEQNIAIILIGHLTKDGAVAGPKTLEHLVDTVIYLENDSRHNYSILRASKNRFGSTNEIGLLEMTNRGFRQLEKTTSLFIQPTQGAAGSAISCLMEGSRPFLLEVQALVSKTFFGYPQRKAVGFDSNRLQILTTVISKQSKINLSNQDVIVSVAGGLKINETALDLAVCAAIASSYEDKPLPAKSLFLGEVGLAGEIRPVGQLEPRLKEALKIGLEQAFLPSQAKITSSKMAINTANNLTTFFAQLWNKPSK